MDVKRVGIQEVGMSLNLFVHCNSSEDAEELASEDLILCNLMIRKRSFQKKKQIQGRQCHKCGKMGHIQFHCTKEKVCWTCGESGHDAKDCKKEKKCILCNSNEHGALYGGCPAKSNHRRELVKIQQEERKKMPVGLREEKKKNNTSSTLSPPSNPVKLSKTQKKRKRRNEKKKMNLTTTTTEPAPKKEVQSIRQKPQKKEE